MKGGTQRRNAGAGAVMLLGAGCATAPLPSGLENFNGGFDNFSRSRTLSFAPPPSSAPMNTRSDALWTYNPGYRSITRAPVNQYGVYYAIPWPWWGGGTVGVGSAGFGSSGTGSQSAPPGFAGRTGGGEGGGRGGGD